MWHTVIRLYSKYDLSVADERDPNTEMMLAQYEFARDNIQGIGIGKGGDYEEGYVKYGGKTLGLFAFSN